MAISIPLENMSVEEKIRVMEVIWDDLCHKTNVMKSPSWHEDVLRDREEAFQSGAEKFIDWELAKRKIRKEIG